MFGIFEVFADTIVICTLTAMVILCSGTAVNYGTAAGAELTISGFTTTYGGWASIFTAVALCCFAFSTIIGWGLYGSRFLVFLCHSDKVAKPFFLVYSFVSILGATVDLGLLWSIADTFNGLMSIPNLIALLLLSGTVVKLTKEFFASEAEHLFFLIRKRTAALKIVQQSFFSCAAPENFTFRVFFCNFYCRLSVFKANRPNFVGRMEGPLWRFLKRPSAIRNSTRFSANWNRRSRTAAGLRPRSGQRFQGGRSTVQCPRV